MTNITEEIFLSFARFPEQAGVLKLFNSGQLNLAGYAALKAAVEGLEEKSLVPGITNFIFGVDEETTKKVIDSISGYYLMVDYGQIQAARNRFEIEENSFFIAVTVAYPINADAMDIVEDVLVADQCLNYLRTIRNYLKNQDRDRMLKEVKFPHQAMPFRSLELNSSIGWSMILTRENAGLL